MLISIVGSIVLSIEALVTNGVPMRIGICQIVERLALEAVRQCVIEWEKTVTE